MAQSTFTEADLRDLSGKLREANHAFARAYPGEPARRQPVHTVYGGAHLFRADTATRIGEIALKAFLEYAPDPATLAGCLAMPAEPVGLAEKVHSRVEEKLSREALEDFRIDFEDGYGHRPDAEEDGHAHAAALEVAKGVEQKSLPPFLGIRIKPFSEELAGRSLRTLDLFVTSLLRASRGTLPANFVVTIPKVVIPEQVATAAEALAKLEDRLGLAADALKLELMIETPQAILNSRGRTALPQLVEAAQGRCTGAHFGTYDYTALCNITAAHQHMLHPACDFARHMMQVALAGTGVTVSDGATNVMPVGPHRAAKGGPALTSEQLSENRAVVHRAWRLAYDHTRHSLVNGYYQGWDLHPAQLPVRYAAVYSFFLEALDAASLRLRTFMEKAAQATLVGDVFDDAATGQGLLNFFLRALNCGAITEDEVHATGLTLDEIRTRSFLRILDGRARK